MEIEENNEEEEKEKVSKSGIQQDEENKIKILEKSKANENDINNYDKSISQLQPDVSYANKLEHHHEGDKQNDNQSGKSCNACEFCEDVCSLEFCKSCEVKRKELYNKYKRYNLEIYQNKLNRSIILNARVHKNILANEYRKMKEVRDLSKSSESVHTFDSESKCKEKEKEDSQSDDNKNCENSKNENSDEKKKKKKLLYYSYIKYKKNFTYCEIKRHCNIDDCWLVANGNVYDVTNFIEEHPGGINCILNKATNDVSSDYSFHSKYAQTAVWNPLKIGRVTSCSKEFVEDKSASNCIFM
ncbi:conserved Plasmodium protein, unknown function [Plasmodium vinckei vinckei]|uniref:Cytochrome b5 heme-binding domain-containing protein n=1 Tax=Plasmodium vinckei vinckei TaxID=54757 RepID=A0A449BTQ9_PLAVN|nr:conserved Plasmodium protein, unknown function [Plasmodium vinckei vinckei]KEG03061.1 hypothetical protein YYE_01992 [Plasmodium vinckei vinckei]VEV56866.1 conserved Plasmodium protein, unknown function [Plasmodium vinckei vinckei]